MLTGISLFLLMPAVNMIVGQMVEPNALAMASGLVIASMNIGGFIAPFYIGLIAQGTGNSSPRTPVLVSAVLATAIAVLWTIVIFIKKEKPKNRS